MLLGHNVPLILYYTYRFHFSATYKTFNELIVMLLLSRISFAEEDSQQHPLDHL